MQTKKYIFWYEEDGKDGYHFFIEALDIEEAYEMAYDSYGPQVEGMLYQEIKNLN